jgi:hypothetical protein
MPAQWQTAEKEFKIHISIFYFESQSDVPELQHCAEPLPPWPWPARITPFLALQTATAPASVGL